MKTDMRKVWQCDDWMTSVSTVRRASVSRLRLGETLVEVQTGIVTGPSGRFQLRAKELELLLHLYQNANVPFTRQQLLCSVWGCRPEMLTRTVDQTIATLRKKIEREPWRPCIVRTLHRVGYELVVDESLKAGAKKARLRNPRRPRGRARVPQ